MASAHVVGPDVHHVTQLTLGSRPGLRSQSLLRTSLGGPIASSRNLDGRPRCRQFEAPCRARSSLPTKVVSTNLVPRVIPFPWGWKKVTDLLPAPFALRAGRLLAGRTNRLSAGSAGPSQFERVLSPYSRRLDGGHGSHKYQTVRVLGATNTR